MGLSMQNRGSRPTCTQQRTPAHHACCAAAAHAKLPHLLPQDAQRLLLLKQLLLLPQQHQLLPAGQPQGTQQRIRRQGRALRLAQHAR